jgi:hypothetical protein
MEKISQKKKINLSQREDAIWKKDKIHPFLKAIANQKTRLNKG